MFRKKLTPTSIRRCAVFLSLAGALALNVSTARGGLALEQSDEQSGLLVPGMLDANSSGSAPVLPYVESSKVVVQESAKPVSNLKTSDVTPGLTGENWFQGLQQGVDHAFDLQPDSTTSDTQSPRPAVTPLDNGVKANAIPSLPSFWSGLTCCIALVIAGLFPRVRRVIR